MSDVLLGAMPGDQPGVVTDILFPIQYEVSISVGVEGTTYEFMERTHAEIEAALSPADDTLTKAAYYQDALTNLRASGIMTFEIYPSSHEGFQALSDEEKSVWNLGLTEADNNYQKKRVIDVAARILLEDYEIPEPSLVSSLTISHGARATFIIDEAGTIKEYYFGPEPIRTSCQVLAGITGFDPGCELIGFFNRRVDSPFTEITSTYMNLDAIRVEEFTSDVMYGTSLRGVWTIDITPILNQLELLGPETVEEFWDAFRGIEFKVFYVSLP
jgi:hypothetical protein